MYTFILDLLYQVLKIDYYAINVVQIIKIRGYKIIKELPIDVTADK